MLFDSGAKHLRRQFTFLVFFLCKFCLNLKKNINFAK
jgi:hypothetical protein